MSLRKLTTSKELRVAQNQFVQDLTSQLPRIGRKFVTFRPSSIELDLYGHGPGQLYFGTRTIRAENKFWNAFGIYDPKRKQKITVEINFALDGGRTAGFFAEDATGRRFLMHTGGIGGGMKGVSSNNFLAWLKPALVEVRDEDETLQRGVMIGELGSKRLAARVESFVQTVRAFKDAVADGLLDDPVFQALSEQWGEYLREFSGRKTGAVDVDLDYVSYHGDVVDALKHWLEGKTAPDQHVTNSRRIDLLVHRNGRLKKVYEVKTSVGRHALYTAIGQLFVHGPGNDIQRSLVLPANENIPDDIEAALQQADIDVLRYTIDDDDVVAIMD